MSVFSPSASSNPSARASALWGGLLIVLAGLAAYANSLTGQFVNDDLGSILNNPTLTHGLISALTTPSGGDTAVGRPLLNLSFALNYEWSGYEIWSYHLVNLSIHLLAALMLYGILRRVLAFLLWSAHWAARIQPVALAATLLWMLHPLQTESVTYIAQRAESLMGVLYLATFYLFLVSVNAPRAWAWQVGSVATCFLGMMSKEVMVTVPVVTLLFDATFLAGSLARAWQARGKYHAAMVATWIPLAWMVWIAGNRGGSAGFGTAVSSPEYAWSQFSAIAHYLALVFWPHPLVADYGSSYASSAPLALATAILILGLVIASLALLRAKSGFGFLGAWFFLILAPSSSIVPISTEIAAEHRMYLPLAALTVLAALGLAACVPRRIFPVIIGAWALAFGALTFARNQDYHSAVQVYHTSVAGLPENDRAHLNLGVVLAKANRLPESVQEYRNALRLNPNAADTEFNLALALELLGQPDQALLHYRQSLRIKPGYLPSQRALAHLLITGNDLADAIPAYAALAQLDPHSAQAHLDLGKAYLRNQQLPPAVAQFQLAVGLDPQDADALFNLGNALTMSGNYSAAMEAYTVLLKIQPGNASARVDVAFCLIQLHRYDEAARAYEDALRADPTNTHAQAGLAEARRLQAATPPAQNTSVAP